MLRFVCRLFSTHAASVTIRTARPGVSPLVAYDDAVKEDAVRNDEDQRDALIKLEQLWKQIEDREKAAAVSDQTLSSSTSRFSWLFGKSSAPAVVHNICESGVYLWGGVGCGKTMLMDIFFNCVSIPKKQRVHFHSFMLEVHSRLHQLRKQGHGGDSILQQVVNKIIEENTLLCFDEFQVTDVADAMILRQLFESLFDRGLVMVATSNREPSELYKNGIQRDFFVPFIHVLETRCSVHHLPSTVDYRLEGQEAETFMFPINERTNRKCNAMFEQLVKGGKVDQFEIQIMGGRTLPIYKGCKTTKVARFTFDELCGLPLGVADYIAVAENFHTVFITNIPMLGIEHINQVRRFINLVDTLYERKIRVIFTAQVAADKIFTSKHGVYDEAFAFDRTVSRLTEMKTREYLLSARHFAASDIKKSIFRSALPPDYIDFMWNRYDLDLNGTLEKEEIRAMLQEFSQIRFGHPNVDDDVLSVALTQMGWPVEYQQRVHVTRAAFESYVRDYWKSAEND